MGKVMIVGAGGVGNVVAHKCAQVPEVFDEICLASRTISKCKDIASNIKRPIRTEQVDADNVPELVKLFKDFKPDIVINVALPYQDLTIMDACLEAKVHYVDTANYEPRDEARFCYKWQWEYHDRFKEAGLTALLGSGFDPGVTNVFTAYALKHHFDEIDELEIVDVNGGDHGHPFATNFNTEINIREITASCSHWEDGKFIETPTMSMSKKFECPENMGTFNIYRMYHEELESLVRHIPTIKRAQFWMSFSDNYLKHLEVIQNIGMASIEPIKFKGIDIIPLQFLKALLPDPGSLGAATKGKTCIGCICKGIKDGKAKEYYIYNICDHEECYREVRSQAISYTTGVPAMIGAMMIMKGIWKREGVFNMEQLDPDPFMDALNIYGLPWKEIVLK
ncbi:MAG: saccharopine dehydrogenase family protein [Leptospirales bacterium]|nr:saccharopine dehydrogenase family protein [Leptospirales bacterium]